MSSYSRGTPITIQHRAILITINQLYRSDMSPLELYEATRGIWVIGPRRHGADYAMAVYDGIVREVYKIDRWYPSGTLDYKTRDATYFSDCDPPRWEFSGKVAEDIRGEYVGRYVGPGSQNPIRYVNVK